MTTTQPPPNGPAWAGLLSAAIGAIAFGIITDLSECSAKISKLLQWYRPAGALSGVGICTVVIWLTTWVVLHRRWKTSRVHNQQALMIFTITLSALSLVLTFPLFYELIGG